jgi:hypothetical protein
MSTAKFDTLSNLAGTQTVPVATVAQGSAKAWVNFNGTGTVAIRASFNVSSITDNGTGDYTVNFTTAMPDRNYAFAGAAGLSTGNGRYVSVDDNPNSTYLAASLRIATNYDYNAKQDCDYVLVAVFR